MHGFETQTGPYGPTGKTVNLTIMVLSPFQTVLSKKSRELFKPRLNRLGLRIVNGFTVQVSAIFIKNKNKNITDS